MFKYKTTYSGKGSDVPPEPVRDLYDESPDGRFTFALPVDGDEVPQSLLAEIEQRTAARVNVFDNEMRELTETNRNLRAEAERLGADAQRREIASAVREEARAEGMLLSAYADAELLGAEQLAVDGNRVTTKDGRSVREWVVDRRLDRAHWFPRVGAPRRPLFN